MIKEVAMRKTVLCIFLICCLIMCCNILIVQGIAFEAEAVDFKIKVNDDYVDIKNPIIAFDDRTYLPLRELSELLDLYVVWDNDSKTVEISDIGITIPSDNSDVVHMDNGTVTVYNVDFKIKLNGYVKELTNPVLVFNDRTYLPLRELAEILDCDVEWIDSKRTVTIEHEFMLESNDELLYRYESNGYYGYTDENGKVIIEPQYTVAMDFSEGLAAVANNEYKFGYIDTSGNLVIPYQYGYAKPFSEGMAEVSTHDYHFDKKRFETDPTGFDWMFYNELYLNSECSYIDKEGNMIIDTVYVRSSGFHDGLAGVIMSEQKDSQWYTPEDAKFVYINTSGDVIYTDEEVVSITDFNCGFAIVEKDNGFKTTTVVIDTDGEVVLDISQYKDAKLSNGFIVLKKDDKYGVIDPSGNIIIDFKYDKLSKYSEGLFAFKINNDCGYIDINGNAVIDNAYEMTDIFINGEALVVLKETPDIMVFINKKGEVISKNMPYCTYDRDSNGMTMIYPEMQGYYVDSYGKQILPMMSVEQN